jgi:DNA polymerase-3 subunit delta'
MAGREGIIEALKRTKRHGKVSHAYIFEGPKGSGKRDLASAFAKSLQCEANGDQACGECISCRVFESGNHPDIIYVAPAGGTKSIGVDDVREQVNRNMGIKPFKYRYKIFFVDNASTMTPAAQNAMLKNVEEPEEYGIFLFMADNLAAFLPTVLSRCVVYKLRPLADSAIEKQLIDLGTDREKARLAACFAQGNLGRAKEITSSEAFMEMRGEAVRLAQAVRRLDIPELLMQTLTLEKYKDQMQQFLDLLILWYRDAMVVKSTGSTDRMIQQDKTSEIYSEAQATELKCLQRKFDAIWDAKKNLARNANFQLAMEAMLLQLRQ